MAKSTMGTKLPRKLEQKMQVVGEQIKLARLRRNLSVTQVAERATCSPLTVSRIEKAYQQWQLASICVYCMLCNSMMIFSLWQKMTNSAGRCRIWICHSVNEHRRNKRLWIIRSAHKSTKKALSWRQVGTELIEWNLTVLRGGTNFSVPVSVSRKFYEHRLRSL